MICDAVAGQTVSSPVCFTVNQPFIRFCQELSTDCNVSCFVLTELQKEEELEAGPRDADLPDTPSLPAGSASTLDVSHPYYDVARHGIIQVCGQ